MLVGKPDIGKHIRYPAVLPAPPASKNRLEYWNVGIVVNIAGKLNRQNKSNKV